MINTKNKYILLLSLLSIIGCGNPDSENENPEPIEQVDPRAADKAEIIGFFIAMGFGFDEDPAEVKKLLDCTVNILAEDLSDLAWSTMLIGLSGDEEAALDLYLDPSFDEDEIEQEIDDVMIKAEKVCEESFG
jgi:hypothetical protein